MNRIGQRIPKLDITDLKPSELIRVALEDLVLCADNDAEYEINMGVWHEPYRMENHTWCGVCLSGAVMAQSLNVATNRDVEFVRSANQKPAPNAQLLAAGKFG